MKYSQADLQANTAAICMYKVIYRIKSLTVNYNKNKPENRIKNARWWNTCRS